MYTFTSPSLSGRNGAPDSTSLILSLLFFVLAVVPTASGQQPDTERPYENFALKIFEEALARGEAYTMLDELLKIGPRLSGSQEAEKAVAWCAARMEQLGFERVRLQPVMVPRWIRGPVERAYAIDGGGKKTPLTICALGGSIATPGGGIRGTVIEIRSWEELHRLGNAVRGKIVFFNRPMDRSLLNPGMAYGGAVDQRSRGAIEAAKYGAIGAIVRSMTMRLDDVPHAGSMGYVDSIPKIPAAAISTQGAETLHRLLNADPSLRVHMTLSCRTLPDVRSANVIGELTGTEKPEEVILIGGHLDSWDKGQGAHDDGAGCIHTIEALRLLTEIGFRPKRTIRAVLFMNEENGLRGGREYAAQLDPNEKHIAAIETDSGGFPPIGFGVTADSTTFELIARWAYLFSPIHADRITRGGGGADISYLTRMGVPSLGLRVHGQSYFDYHHSDNDVIASVHERDLELGAAVIALLASVLAEEGLDTNVVISSSPAR